MADFEGFAKDVMKAWPERGVDGFELQDLAEKHRLIVKVPGGYDPEHHFDEFGLAPEKGDPWYEIAYKTEG